MCYNSRDKGIMTMEQYKIVIDALGSDKGPETVMLGVSLTLKEFPNLSITVVGPEDLINEKIKENTNITVDVKNDKLYLK